MRVQEIKDFIVNLLNREIEEEYNYQKDGEKDVEYIKQCIIAKQWILKKGSKGIMELVNNIIIADDIKDYIKSLQ